MRQSFLRVRKMCQCPHSQTDLSLVRHMAVAGLMPQLGGQVNEAHPSSHSSRTTCTGTLRHVCPCQHQGSGTSMTTSLSSTSAGDDCSNLIEGSEKHLLGVCSSGQFGKRAVRADGPQEDGLELVHARICKEQGGIISRHHRAGWNHLMLLAPEEVQEGCSDPLPCR